MKKLACCITETRPIENLVKIINDHLKFLPEHDLYIFYGPKTAYLKPLFPQATFEYIPDPFGVSEYNQMLCSTTFWRKFVSYHRVLIFQSDSGILRTGLEEFLEMPYGYIGAPIWHNIYALNGGLSLRDPRLMHEICSKYTWESGNEDMNICDVLFKYYPDRLATREVAELFSTESIFELGSLGYHAIESHLTPEQCLQIKNQYKNMETNDLEKLCREILDDYPDAVNHYKLGKKGLIGVFAGESMKRSKGLADPKEIVKILKKLLDEK